MKEKVELIKLLYNEVSSLIKFKKAVYSSKIVEAAKHLKVHKESSDGVEVMLKTTLADARAEIDRQSELINNLRESI